MIAGLAALKTRADERSVQGPKFFSVSRQRLFPAYDHIVATEGQDGRMRINTSRTFELLHGLRSMKNGRLLIWIAVIILLAALIFSYW
jgi:hypothetical protein